MHRTNAGQLGLSPRLLVAAFSFLATGLALLLSVTCLILALDKRSDPNAAISLPSGQKFSAFFTAGIFFATMPLPLLAFVSVCLHRRRGYPPSSPASRSKFIDLVTLKNLSLPPNRPFLFVSANFYRLLLTLAIVIQLIDGIAFVVVVCILKNSDICLFAGRVVLCNLLTKEQKIGIVIPGALQILAEIVILLLIQPYARQLDKASGILTDFRTFDPITMKAVEHSQGSFEMVPGFDIDHPDLEKANEYPTSTLYDRGHGPVDAPENEILSAPHSTLYDDAGSFDQYKFKPFKMQSKPTRSMSTASAGSQMQGPRPAPKRSGTSLMPLAPTSIPPPTSTNNKNKAWFKRFKSKNTEKDADEDEIDAAEAEGLVSGSDQRHRLTPERSALSEEDGYYRDADGDADAEDEDEGRAHL